MPVFVRHGSPDPARVPNRSGGVRRFAPEGASIGLWITLIMFGGSIGAMAQEQAPAPASEPSKSVKGFGEARRGDVPEGTAEMITPDTDEAIQNGLAWLARTQNGDGSFGSGMYRGNIAVTSVAGLAFMASGSSPGRGPYGSQIDKALVYVMDNTSPSGFIAVVSASTHGPMYSHGFGTLFLAEAYGMTHRPEIREKLQKAVRVIIDSQNNEGGWRYQPVKRDADISVTICQINALRAARNAGLYVPKDTVDACIRYVKQSQNPDGGFRYMLQGGANSEFPRSAAGVVALQSSGEYDSKEVRDGIAYLRHFSQGLRPSGRRNNHYFYGQYYAAQAMWIQGGEAWAEWYPAIREELLRRQLSSGCWNDNGVCNEYGTAMALIVLQIPNDYLPIFQR
jgi:Prenyltransferase and squalene oxidase repeat